jgi:hypothetical protein
MTERYWRDKRLTDMTKEELIEALETLHDIGERGRADGVEMVVCGSWSDDSPYPMPEWCKPLLSERQTKRGSFLGAVLGRFL